MFHKTPEPSQDYLLSIKIFYRMIDTLHRIFAKLLWKPQPVPIIAPTNETIVLSLDHGSYSTNDSYLICLATSIDESAFLLKAKVKPGTYAGELLANLYDEIFNCSLELKRDYSDYYAIEYGTFDAYVRKRFLFTPEVVSEISTLLVQSCQIIYFQPSHYFLKDDYGTDFLKRLFEPRDDL